MDDVTVADLPEGSVVASAYRVYIKEPCYPGSAHERAPWKGTHGGYHTDDEIQIAMRYGTVLRVGYP